MSGYPHPTRRAAHFLTQINPQMAGLARVVIREPTGVLLCCTLGPRRSLQGRQSKVPGDGSSRDL